MDKQLRYRLRHPERIKAKNKRQYKKRRQRAEVDLEFGQQERARKNRSNIKYRKSDNGVTAQQAWVIRKKEQDPNYFSKIKANWSYKNQYGITLDQYEVMFAAQNGRCAICGQLQNHKRQKRLHIDHDHGTKVVRKLLCYGCNIGVGYFGDDPAVLRAAATYIDAHRPPPMLFG
jgi:hypothetical protein